MNVGQFFSEILIALTYFFFHLFPRQDVLNQFSMVNLELYNIVEDIKKVSKAFVVHPKNVNAENATSMSLFILPLCSGTLVQHLFDEKEKKWIDGPTCFIRCLLVSILVFVNKTCCIALAQVTILHL